MSEQVQCFGLKEYQEWTNDFGSRSSFSGDIGHVYRTKEEAEKVQRFLLKRFKKDEKNKDKTYTVEIYESKVEPYFIQSIDWISDPKYQ